MDPVLSKSPDPSTSPHASTPLDASVATPAAPDTRHILQTGTAYWVSKTLFSAVELGVFTELGRGPAPLESLRVRLGLHARAARDFLDALVALGFLEREGNVYRNAPDAAAFLDRSKPGYIGALLEMLSYRTWVPWGGLTDALRTGQPQNDVAGGGDDSFNAVYSTAERLRSFVCAMTAISLPLAQALARQFPWEQYKTVFDIGGAQGCVPVQVARAHPHIKGGVLDLPKVAPLFKDLVEQHGVSDRLRFVAGNMFQDEWPPADVYIMGHILHDWGLERKRALLAQAHRQLPPGGALIVYDAMIDNDRRQNVFGLLMSLNMLIETQDGFDYTPADACGWFQDAGFHDIRSASLGGTETMVVGTK